MAPVDLVKRSYDSFTNGDLDTLLEDLHPDIEWHQAQGLPHGGLHRGIDDVRRNIFEPLDASWWEGFTAEPDEFLQDGDQVVVLGRYRGIAKESRKQLDVPFVHIWTVTGDKAVRFRQFLDTAGWVEALRI
jgi:ketosteroid isomerase-like protein